jgi:hypothetical protein
MSNLVLRIFTGRLEKVKPVKSGPHYCCIREAMNLIGRISDVVRSGRGFSFVERRSEGEVMAMQCNSCRLQY